MYDVVSRKDTFAKTTQEIAEYVRCKFNNAGEFCTGMVEMRLMPLTEPMAPTNDDQLNSSFGRWHIEPTRNKLRHAVATPTESMHLSLDSALKPFTTGWRPVTLRAASMMPQT